MSQLNGKSAVLALESTQAVEDTKSAKPKASSNRQNKPILVNLDLDAGSSNCKYVINGYADSFPSILKEVTGELPLGISGCFSIGVKNYAVGSVTNSLNGNMIEGFKDNKIRYLHCWLIGALASHPDFLSDAASSRKYKGKPVRIRLSLRLLSLSSSKRNEISKILNTAKNFAFEGTEFQMEICNSDYLLPEGYGAALEARKHLPEGTRQFHILDLGGGTLTFSSYKLGSGKPRANEQSAASGNGMKAVIERLSIALSREDKGGIQYKKDLLEASLRNSKPLGDGKHAVLYRHGQQSLEIGEIVIYSLDEWVAAFPIVENLLNQVSQALLNGEYVFATGGGFAISVISHWLEQYCTRDVEAPKFFALDNPQNINLTGLRLLDEAN